MSRKRQLIEAARDLFLKEGLAGMTMRRVANAVGVTATAIYRHFENKDDLLREVVSVGSERFAAYLVRGLRGESPIERLRKTGEAYLDFAFDYPADYRIMFLSWDRLSMGVHSEAGEAHSSPTLRFLLDRVAECLPAELREDQEAILRHALLFWAQVHGMASLYVAGGGQQLYEGETFRGMAREQANALVDLWERSLPAAREDN